MSSYLQLKKRAFMSIVNGVKGFVRSVQGVPPISLEDCVDSDSLIDWKLYGNSVQEGTPSPENSIPVVSVGEYDSETGKYKIPVTARGESSSITTYIYLDEPLRKVGDYADYVDFGKGEVVRNAKELELTSTNLYWSAYIFEAGSFYGFSSALSSMLSGNRQAGFCTHLQNIIGGTYTSPIWFGVNSNRLFVSFPDIYNSAETNTERVTAFKAYLTEQAEAGTPVKVTYILAEPTRTPISLPKLPTIKGTTIYEIGTSLNASNMEATYYSTVKGE